MKHFPDRRQIRINPPQLRILIRLKFPIDIRKRVNPVAVQTRNLRPPKTVLQQIFFNDGILRIHVGQNSEKPPSVRFCFIHAGAYGSTSDSNGSFAAA